MKPVRVSVAKVAVLIAALAVFVVAQAGPTNALATAEPDWGSLVQGSTLVVRAQVIATTSDWDAGHTQIVSEHTVAIRYVLHGKAPAQVHVHTVGGTLTGGLSMVATGMPVLATGEEVVLFLAPDGDGYVIAGNDDGKYVVENTFAINRPSFVTMPLAALYTALATVDSSIVPPPDWAQREAAVQPEPVVGGLDFVYNNLKWPVNRLEFKVNVNSTHAGSANGTAADYLSAIVNAALTWSMVDDADFTYVYTGTSTSTDIGYNQANEVVFVDKGLTDPNGNSMPLAVARVYFIGQMIVEADIWINDAWNWDATGKPTGNEPDLQSTVLHELGHWLSLGHDTDDGSIMYPRITLGALKRLLGNNDRRGIASIYPCAAGSRPCNPVLTPTPTPTPTLTPTPTATPMPESTVAPSMLVISPETGGTLVFSPTAHLQIALEAPKGAIEITTTLLLHHVDMASEEEPAGEQEIECFDVTADQGDGELTSLEFSAPMTITLRYSDTVLAGSREESLVLFAYNVQAANWSEGRCGAVKHDVANNQLIIPICRLSTYGIFGNKPPAIYLPLIKS